MNKFDNTLKSLNMWKSILIDFPRPSRTDIIFLNSGTIG